MVGGLLWVDGNPSQFNSTVCNYIHKILARLSDHFPDRSRILEIVAGWHAYVLVSMGSTIPEKAHDGFRGGPFLQPRQGGMLTSS